ncbi:MAG: metallophosphoesterase [Acidobacteria bacterium]|nr:metallophosphoesterase [Acidobacteriota bacterium]
MRRFIAALALVACLGAPAAQAPPRLVVVSDVHGDLGQFVTVLTQAGVIDGARKWTGGTTVVVQTGDVPDRGPDSRKVMDLLMDLEKQARKAGGVVHALLGNHEVMNMVGDLRYVTPEEYASYRSADAERMREQAYAMMADRARIDDPAYRAAWFAERPLGWVELQQAFGPRGKYGTWLRKHDAVVKVGDTLFVHGGISPKYATVPAADINARVRASLASKSPFADPLMTDGDGPLWYRGLAYAPEAELAAHVDALLAFHGVARIVVGHTTAPGVVLPRFGGKVILNDVGLSSFYGGPASSLQIEGGAVSVRHRGTLIPLPASNDLGAYLAAAAGLDPQESRLRTWIAQGATWPEARAAIQQ